MQKKFFVIFVGQIWSFKYCGSIVLEIFLFLDFVVERDQRFHHECGLWKETVGSIRRTITLTELYYKKANLPQINSTLFC